MLLKGIISKINPNATAAEVILPEYDNAVTAMLPFVDGLNNVKVGDKCLVGLFSNSFSDGVIIASAGASAPQIKVVSELPSAETASEGELYECNCCLYVCKEV